MNSWMHAVMQCPLNVSVAIIVVLSLVVPWLSVRLARRIWPHPVFKENNELVGFAYAVYGLIYGVLLAFTIIVTWGRYADTEALVMREATHLSELWRDSKSFPADIRDNIHKDLLAYVRSVIDDEWPAMAARGQAHPKTKAIYEHLWEQTYHIQPTSKNQEAYLSEFLARMNDLSGNRRLRILNSKMEVHRILWVVLLIGAIPTVGYTLLFSNKHGWVQVAVMASIVLIVQLGLLVTLSLQYPFSGDVSIRPDAFREVLEAFSRRM